MTSFVHLNYSTTHSGVSRVESAIGAAQQLRQQFAGGLFKRVDSLLCSLAQARLDWATLNADLNNRSLRAS